MEYNGKNTNCKKKDKFISKNQLRKTGIILIHMKVLPSQEFTDKNGWLKYKWRSAIQCIDHSHIVDLDLVVVGAGH